MGQSMTHQGMAEMKLYVYSITSPWGNGFVGTMTATNRKTANTLMKAYFLDKYPSSRPHRLEIFLVKSWRLLGHEAGIGWTNGGES